MAARNPTEFLNSVLLYPGPAELPYGEDMKWTIRQHIMDLVQEFEGMCIKLKNYTRPDGRVVLLLVLEGTLPIYYRGTRYNIPVVVWLPEKYPRQSPFLYVTPTPDMVIKPGHSFVDGTGLVRSVYIHSWQYPRSNLNEMAHDTAIQFGSEPPLFSKPPGWSAAHAAPAGPGAAGGTHQQPVSGGGGGAGGGMLPAHPPPPAMLSPPVPESGGQQQQQQGDGSDTLQVHNPLQQGQSSGRPYGGSMWGPAPASAQASPPASTAAQQPEEPVVTKQELQDGFRTVAIESLTQRLRARLAEERDTVDSEVQELLDVQAQLRARGGELDRAVAAAAAERDGLEASLQDMAVRRVEMESWLEQYEAKVPASLEDVDPDVAIVPCDQLGRQALEAHAMDLSVEESLYSLDKALQRGLLQPEVYLKQVRQLCRKQYYARALGNKVADKQQRAAAALSRFQQRSLNDSSLQMPQGDSWVSTGVLPNPLASAMR